MFTNGVHIDYEQYGTMDLLTLGFFYNLYYIKNMLALVDVTIQFRVTMDTNNEPAMYAHTVPDYILKFYQCHEELYYFDNSDPNVFNIYVHDYSFLTTI